MSNSNSTSTSTPTSKKGGSSSVASDGSGGKHLFALRPNRGIDGQPIAIFANHFPIKYMSDQWVHHYDIDMEMTRLDEDLLKLSMDDKPANGTEDKAATKRFRKLDNKIYRIVVEEAIKRYSGANDIFDGVLPVYDGQKNLYSKKELNIERFTVSGDRQTARITVEVPIDGRTVNYALNIKKASVIDMSGLKRYFEGKGSTPPSDAIQVLNIILRHGPSLYRLPIANSLFSPHSMARKEERQSIGGGRQLAFGYSQSVRPEANGASLVIDRATTALYESGILPKIMAGILRKSRDEFTSLREIRDSERRCIEKELEGVMIQVKHLTYSRKYKFLGLTKEAVKDVQFEEIKTDPRGNQQNLGITSVIAFYEKNYPDVTIRFTDLPCVKVGNIKKPCYLPIDVCEVVPDQHVRKNLTADQNVEMIRASASQTPARRLEMIKESARVTVEDSKAYMKEFGIIFPSGNKPLKIDARVLKPPSISYGQRRNVVPFGGKWDIRGQKFYVPAQLKHWFIISFTPAVERQLGLLERMIIETGRGLGMEVSEATKKVTLQRYASDSVANVFKKAMAVTEGRLQLIVFIISPKYSYLYESIKKVGDVDYGIVTQCLKETNLSNLKPPLMQNIMLKMNSKLGGINAILDDKDLLPKNTMIVGVDCSHPGVGDRMSRSVSACVASIDDTYVKYFATTRLQQKPQEINSELQDMMVDLLKEYWNRNRQQLPDHIIVYRDGVSEGQFNAALKEEIEGLKKTFCMQSDGYEPCLTYIVVQKRHHTRFFPQNPNEGVGRAKNVPPGLVVDTDVISKTHFDYFMCSHEGIQGTSRPTHYFVLKDDNQFSADQLQNLTFSLAHIYARCTRSISSPAPVAYAHLAAYRAQRHIIGLKQNEESDSGSHGGSSVAGVAAPRHHGADSNGSLIDRIAVRPDYKSTMYFC